MVYEDLTELINDDGLFIIDAIEKQIKSNHLVPPHFEVSLKEHPICVERKDGAPIDSRIDLIIGGKESAYRLTGIIEAKKSNPSYNTWVFFEQKKRKEKKFNLFSYHNVSGNMSGHKRFEKYLWRMTNLESIFFSDVSRQASYNFEEQKISKIGNGRKCINNDIEDACFQVIKCVYGYMNGECGVSKNSCNEIIFPIIITTANLVKATYNSENVDEKSGNITKLNFESIPFVAYNYPLNEAIICPASESVEGIKKQPIEGIDIHCIDEQNIERRHFFKKMPIFIVKLENLMEFLRLLDTFS